MSLIDFRNRYFNHWDSLVPHQVTDLLPDGGEICCLTGFFPRREAFRAFLCPSCLTLLHGLAFMDSPVRSKNASKKVWARLVARPFKLFSHFLILEYHIGRGKWDMITVIILALIHLTQGRLSA